MKSLQKFAILLIFTTSGLNGMVLPTFYNRIHPGNGTFIYEPHTNFLNNHDEFANHFKAYKIHKPRFVMTVLTNSKQILPMNGTNMNPVEPLIFDPFRRLLQSFFMNFARDFGEPMNFKKNHTVKNGTIINGFKKNCSHKLHIQNLDCNEVENSSTPGFAVKTIDVSKITLNKPIENDQNEIPIMKRHYFLSISGGTGKSAAAFKLDQVGEEKNHHLKDLIRKISIKKILELPERFEKDNMENIYNNQSFYRVTIPAFLVIGLLIIGVCFCMRKNGFCCKLFLTDPTKSEVVIVSTQE